MAYSVIKKPSEYFNTKLYTGNGTSQSITGIEFAPKFTWIKNRTSADSHILFDIIRGATYRLNSNTTVSEFSIAQSLTAFNSDGFSVGSYSEANTSGNSFVSWNWRGSDSSAVSNTDGSITSTVSANTTSGFSIVTWTGNATASQSVGHGLGAVPKVILTKNTDNGTQPWKCYFSEVGNADYLQLNTTDTPATSGVWSNTTPSSSLIYISNDTGINGSGNTILAYCFAEKQGYSKFGSYTGNGNADGPFVYTGFKPAMIIMKRSDASGSNWRIFDNKRSTSGFNVTDKALRPSTSDAEITSNIDFLSNGVKIRNTDGEANTPGGTYIYMAFAEEPLVGDNPATAR